jgi:hypothetical protein
VTAALSTAATLLFLLACTKSSHEDSLGSVSSRIEPRLVEGTSTCEQLGVTSLLEVDAHALEGAHPLSGGGSVFVSSDFRFFDWRSTVPIDLVIVTGEASSRIYEGGNDILGRGLEVPPNVDGGPGTIRQIDFCSRGEVLDAAGADTGSSASPDGGGGAKTW